jgi:hypothetical protein
LALPARFVTLSSREVPELLFDDVNDAVKASSAKRTGKQAALKGQKSRLSKRRDSVMTRKMK